MPVIPINEIFTIYLDKLNFSLAYGFGTISPSTPSISLPLDIFDGDDLNDTVSHRCNSYFAEKCTERVIIFRISMG